MKNLGLLVTQKNELFSIIMDAGLDPKKFSWSEVTSQMTKTILVSRLQYPVFDFYYVFDFLNTRHYAIFSPGREKSIDEEYVGSWEIQLQFFKDWLKQLKKETSEADLWTEIINQQVPSDFDFEADVLANQFTPHQLANVTEGLNQIRRYIQKDTTLPSQHHDLVMKRLDYLEEAAKRMNVKDWILVCIGMLFQTALQFAFTAQQTKTIFEIVRNALQIAKQCLPHIL